MKKNNNHKENNKGCNLMEKIKCRICGKESEPATPLWRICRDCYILYRNAEEPKVFTLGHPANQSYMYEENTSAIKIWEEHLKKYGYEKKWGRWIKKK